MATTKNTKSDTDTTTDDDRPDDWANSGQLSSPTSDPADRVGPGTELSEEDEAALRSGELGRVTLTDLTDQPSTVPIENDTK